MTRINIFLPKIVLDQIKKIADSKGVGYSEIIRRIIDNYLGSQKR